MGDISEGVADTLKPAKKKYTKKNFHAIKFFVFFSIVSKSAKILLCINRYPYSNYVKNKFVGKIITFFKL
jgi:hypothetical protein